MLFITSCVLWRQLKRNVTCKAPLYRGAFQEGDNMKLAIMERVLALGALPEKGSLANMRLQNNLINKLGLSPDEITEYEVKLRSWWGISD